jgi:hypothetical protein
MYEDSVSQSEADTPVNCLKNAAHLRDEFMKDPAFWRENLAKHKFCDV